MLERALVLAAAGLTFAGCGRARLIHRHQHGGVIALEGAYGKAMEDAHQYMTEHCRGPYTVVEEGEHVIGTDGVGGEDTNVAEDGTVVEEGGQSTREATEWRIRYVCGQNVLVPPPEAEPGYDQGPDGEPPPGY